MKWITVFLVPVLGLLIFTSTSGADDLIRVKTSLYELKPGVSDIATQTEMAKLAAVIEGDTNRLRFETSTITSSGKWFTSKKTKTIHYPANYSDTQLIRSKSDPQVYSIEATSETDHPNTILIPGHATDFTEKELGTTVKLKPTRKSDGTISIEGSVTEVTLVDLAAANETPIITSQRKADTSLKKEIGSDAQKAPLISTSTTSLSNRLEGDGTPYYAIIKMKRSCLANPIEAKPGPIKGGGTRTITSKQSADTSAVVIYPARPGEEVSVLVAISAKAIKEPATSPAAKGEKIYLTVRFVESDTPMNVPPSVLSDPKFQLLIRSLNQQKGVDLLSTPSVTAVSGEQSKISLGREFIYPKAYDAPEYDLEKANNGKGFPVTPATPIEFETIELGIEMKLTATIRSDGNIAIQNQTRLSEFEGFINYGNPIVETKINLLGKAVPITISDNQILSPVFSTREHESSFIIPNGANGIAYSLADTQERIYEDSGPLGLNKRISRENKRREVIAIIKAERMK